MNFNISINKTLKNLKERMLLITGLWPCVRSLAKLMPRLVMDMVRTNP